MGSDPVSFFVNLLLFYYKNRCIKKEKGYDIRGATRLASFFSFIDDLTALHLGGEFGRSFKDMRPLELYSGRKI